MNNENLTTPNAEVAQAQVPTEQVSTQPLVAPEANDKKKSSKIWIVLSVVLAVILAGFGVCFYVIWMSNNYEPTGGDSDGLAVVDDGESGDEEVEWLTAETGILGLRFDYPATWTAKDTTKDTSITNTEGELIEIRSWQVKSPNGTTLQLTDVSMGGVGGPYNCEPDIGEGYFIQSFHKEASAKLPGYNVVSSLQDDGVMRLRLSALADNVLDKGEIDLCKPQYDESNWGQDYFQMVEVGDGVVVFSNFSPASATLGLTGDIDERDFADAVKILASLR